MIVFGTCVGGKGERYESITLPSLRKVVAGDDVVLTRPGDAGIAVVYNAFIDETLAMPEVEALVLLHDDVEIVDPHFRSKVLRHLSVPDAGVVGVAGGAGLRSLEWWTARTRVGRVFETRRVMDFGARRGEVDVVDGLLLVISPDALHHVRFDEEAFPRFHGYDVDYCLAVKDAGFTVSVAPIDVLHRTKTGYGAKDEFDRADVVLREKWPQYVRPMGQGERVARTVASTGSRVSRGVVKARAFVGLGDGKRGSRSVEQGLLAEPEADLVAVAHARAEFLSLFLLAGTVLELGSGQGLFLRAAEEIGLDASGIEPDAALVTAAQRDGLDVCAGDLNGWARRSRGQRVDALVCWSASEWLAHPEAAGRAASLLARGGVLVAELDDDPDRPMVDRCRDSFTEAGLELLSVVYFSTDHYLSTRERLDRRNRALLDQNAWPVTDRVRIVARLPAEQPGQL